jgi:hypothetical protein
MELFAAKKGIKEKGQRRQVMFTMKLPESGSRIGLQTELGVGQSISG